ncbi:MAG: ABC transporter permease DevC [Cyanophyceae cyanobacterium]
MNGDVIARLQRLHQGLRRRTPLGWLQLRRDLGRLAVALAGIALADILMFMQLGFRSALYDSNTRIHRIITGDIVLMSRQARNLIDLGSFPRRRLYQASGIEGVKDINLVYVNLSRWKRPDSHQETAILVLGIDPNHPPLELPGLERAMPPLKLSDRVLFDRQSRGPYGAAISRVERGEAVITEINGHQVRIMGTYGIGASFAADGNVLVSHRTFLRMFPQRSSGAPSLGILTLDEPCRIPSQRDRIIANLRQQLPQDIKILSKEEFIAFEKQYWTDNTAVAFVFTLGTIMGFIVGAIIVYQILATDASDHIPEYATLKAMGFRHRYLLGVIFEESIILAAIGFVPGLSVTLGLYALTRRATNLPMLMTVSRALMVLFLTAAMCVVSGAIAARRLEAADPADLF